MRLATDFTSTIRGGGALSAECRPGRSCGELPWIEKTLLLGRRDMQGLPSRDAISGHYARATALGGSLGSSLSTLVDPGRSVHDGNQGLFASSAEGVPDVLVTSAAARAPFACRDTLSDERLVPRATQTAGSDINRSAPPACPERGSASAGPEFSRGRGTPDLRC